jgi:hypothetical protein
LSHIVDLFFKDFNSWLYTTVLLGIHVKDQSIDHMLTCHDPPLPWPTRPLVFVLVVVLPAAPSLPVLSCLGSTAPRAMRSRSCR